MRRNCSWITLALVVIVAGCTSEPVASKDPGTRTESATLVRTLRTALREALPDSPPAAVEATLTAMRDQYREALGDTGMEEAAMEAGRFDDTGNRKRLVDLLEIVDRQQVRVHTVIRFLLNQLEGNNLQGVKLELVVRLLDVQVKAASVQRLQNSL